MSADATNFPKDEADYKKLEKLVAKIQQDLAPRSRVSHNVRLKGKSGAQRQIDVLVEDRVGPTSGSSWTAKIIRHPSTSRTSKSVRAFLRMFQLNAA